MKSIDRRIGFLSDIQASPPSRKLVDLSRMSQVKLVSFPKRPDRRPAYLVGIVDSSSRPPGWPLRIPCCPSLLSDAHDGVHASLQPWLDGQYGGHDGGHVAGAAGQHGTGYVVLKVS